VHPSEVDALAAREASAGELGQNRIAIALRSLLGRNYSERKRLFNRDDG
jgi:hypothetical protein